MNEVPAVICEAITRGVIVYTLTVEPCQQELNYVVGVDGNTITRFILCILSLLVILGFFITPNYDGTVVNIEYTLMKV